MSKIHELMTKINDAIRPPHTGPLPPTDITALGGNLSGDGAAEFGAGEAAKASQQTIGPMTP
jgi:hypothetical protein